LIVDVGKGNENGFNPASKLLKAMVNRTGIVKAYPADAWSILEVSKQDALDVRHQHAAGN
jgi:hypothetical protein